MKIQCGMLAERITVARLRRNQPSFSILRARTVQA